MRSRGRTKRRRASSVVALALVAGATLASPGAARADDAGDAKRACVSAHERTQRARLSGSLVEARALAIECAQERCPALVRAECARLLDDVEAALPRVSFEVRDGAGARVPNLVVEVDGVALAEAVEGRPVALDPGLRRLRITTPDGRAIEEDLVLLEGEVRRRVTVTLPARPEAGPELAVGVERPSGASPLAAVAADSSAPSRAELPWPLFVLGGVGVAGLGTFAAFGLRGYREEVALETACAPACAPGREDAMRRDYLVADVALASGVAALAAAAVLYLVHGAGDAKPRATALVPAR